MKIELKTCLNDSYNLQVKQIDFSQNQLRIIEDTKEESFWFFPTNSIISFKVVD